jgi:hypothetical protein
MGRKPAANTFVLQVSVQPIGKELVLGRVADETRVELNFAAAERWKVFDQALW